MDIVGEWVQFDIPYIIQVEDSFEGNEHARFYPSIDGIQAELRFMKEARDVDGRPGMMFGQVEGDRLGNVSYTKVQAGLSREFLETLPAGHQRGFEAVTEGHPTKWLRNLDDREGRIIHAGVEYLNRFLEVYRAALGYYWIRGVSPSEVVYFMRTTVAEDGEQYHHGSMYPRGGLKPGTATLDDEARDTLQSRLQSEHQVPIQIVLDLDTQDKLDLGEHRLAVITAGTMFEAFLKDGLRELMATEGMTDGEIKGVFVDEGDFTPVSKLAKGTVPKTLHFDFESTEEYEAWDEDTREMRNAVIHEGYIPSEQEARNAYEAAKNAVEFLTEKMSDRIEELAE